MPLYTAEASATGGRNGVAKSSDGVLTVGLTLPKELGGPGAAGKTNPEQLRLHVKLPENNTVTGKVHIGKDAEGGLGLAVDLSVNAPGLDKATTQKVVDLAHTICPYSRATRGNIDVTLSV
ncbi:putative organic hydroperoxide resistance protein, partial [Linderina pennispora]